MTRGRRGHRPRGHLAPPRREAAAGANGCHTDPCSGTSHASRSCAHAPQAANLVPALRARLEVALDLARARAASPRRSTYPIRRSRSSHMAGIYLLSKTFTACSPQARLLGLPPLQSATKHRQPLVETRLHRAQRAIEHARNLLKRETVILLQHESRSAALPAARPSPSRRPSDISRRATRSSTDSARLHAARRPARRGRCPRAPARSARGARAGSSRGRDST